MAGIFGISVDPATYEPQWGFGGDLLLGTHYHQHHGEEWGGYSLVTDGVIQKPERRPGLFRQSFQAELFPKNGQLGIGYVGGDREPYYHWCQPGDFSVCYTGNITNAPELIERLLSFGVSFRSPNPPDIEIISHLIARGSDIIDGLQIMNREVEGAFSLLVMTPQGIYAVCDQSAVWPLILGRKDGAIAVAMENCSFENTGFRNERQLKPGEVVFISNGIPQTQVILGEDEELPTKHCSFLWVYTAHPGSSFEVNGNWYPVSSARRNLGRILARRDIANDFFPDMVMCSPDSGRYGGQGYMWEFVEQVRKGLIPPDKLPFWYGGIIKFSYAGRSYTPANDGAREMEAITKTIPVQEQFPDMKVVFVDDSIRRGRVLGSRLVPKIKLLGFDEIHVRITNPESVAGCPYSKTVQQGADMLAARMTPEESAQHLDVSSVGYNEIPDIAEAIGVPLETICIDCDIRPENA